MMIHKYYKDFNEAYYELNRFFLLNPQYVEDQGATGAMSLVGPILLEIDSPDCSKLDLATIGYGTGKWSHLLRSYLGLEKYQELKGFGHSGNKGLSLAFDFRRKKEGNGSCLREIVLSRSSRSRPFNEITVFWRSVELQSKWMVDLILIKKIIDILPNAEIDTIRLYFSQAHQNSKWIGPLIEPVFHIDPETLDETYRHTKGIKRQYFHTYVTKFDSDTTYSKLVRMKKVHEKYLAGEELETITEKDLEGLDEFYRPKE